MDLHTFLTEYLEDANRRLDELNAQFITRVPYGSRPYVEQVLSELACALQVIEVVRRDPRVTPPRSD